MLRKIAKTLTLKSPFFYSAQEKKNIIVVPKRHQISINTFNLLESEI
jgi:hypothetical protein